MKTETALRGVALLLRLFARQKGQRPTVCAVIAAGGRSSRMGGENKLLAPLDGVPVLAHTLRAFEECAAVDEIIVAAHSEHIVTYSQLCEEYAKVRSVVAGGATRTESVYKALLEVSPSMRFICVHDAARPLIRPEEITAVLRSAFAHNAALACAPLVDTLKAVKGGMVTATLDREGVMLAQTPQAFDAKLLLAAYQNARERGLTFSDDCAAVEALGMKPMLVPCSRENIKITTPSDLLFAEAALAARNMR